MPSPLERTDETAAAAQPQTPTRRRPPNWTEQQRRKAWGRTWGAVGAEYAKKRRAEGK